MSEHDMISKLRGRAFEAFKLIKRPCDITSFVIGEEWTDDHERCMDVIINNERVSFWWITREFVRDLYRIEDDPKGKTKKIITAKKSLIGYIQYEIEEGELEMVEEKKESAWDEFVKQSNHKNIISVKVVSPLLRKNSSDFSQWKKPHQLPSGLWNNTDNKYWPSSGFSHVVDLRIIRTDGTVMYRYFHYTIGNLTDKHTPRLSSVRIWNALTILKQEHDNLNAMTIVLKKMGIVSLKEMSASMHHNLPNII